MRRALAIISAALLMWGIGLTGAAAASEGTQSPLPKQCTSDGPSDVPETDGSDTTDGADDALEKDGTDTEDGADDAPETDGSDTEETDGTDDTDGSVDFPEHQTSGQKDDDGSTDPEGAPDLTDGSADSKDGYLDLPDRKGDPDGDGPDTKDSGKGDDGRLDFPEYKGQASPVPSDDDDNKEGSLDQTDGAVDRPEHQTSGQKDDDGSTDPEGAPDLTDGPADTTDGADDKPETDGSDAADGAADIPETDGSDAKETDGSDEMEPEDCEGDTGGDTGGDAEPAAKILGEACDSGGVGVLLDNSKVDTATEFTIVSAFGDSTETVNVTVPAGETKNAVAPTPTDIQGTITVSAGDEVILESTGTLICGGDGDDGGLLPIGDGNDFEQKGSQLPFTGSPIGLIVLVAAGFLVAGAATLGGLKLARTRS